jgi:hypothetical protein
MQTLSERKLVGYVEIQVGTFAVRVPVRSAEPATPGTGALPVATFDVEGETYAISVQGDAGTAAAEEAVRKAAEDAFVHLSRKLLN